MRRFIVESRGRRCSGAVDGESARSVRRRRKVVVRGAWGFDEDGDGVVDEEDGYGYDEGRDGGYVTRFTGDYLDSDYDRERSKSQSRYGKLKRKDAIHSFSSYPSFLYSSSSYSSSTSLSSSSSDSIDSSFNNTVDNNDDMKRGRVQRATKELKTLIEESGSCRCCCTGVDCSNVAGGVGVYAGAGAGADNDGGNDYHSNVKPPCEPELKSMFDFDPMDADIEDDEEANLYDDIILCKIDLDDANLYKISQDEDEDDFTLVNVNC